MTQTTDNRKIEIAVIDDEVMNLEMLGFIIGQLGFKSIAIQHSLEAIEILEKSIPELILLDVRMPKMSWAGKPMKTLKPALKKPSPGI